MPLVAFFIAVHTSIVLFQCHVAQCLASWGHGPTNPPLYCTKEVPVVPYEISRSASTLYRTVAADFKHCFHVIPRNHTQFAI